MVSVLHCTVYVYIVEVITFLQRKRKHSLVQKPSLRPVLMGL